MSKIFTSITRRSPGLLSRRSRSEGVRLVSHIELSPFNFDPNDSAINLSWV